MPPELLRFFRLLSLSLLILPLAACKHPPAVPDELVGTWVTQDAKYQGKSLAIDQEFIVTVLDEDTTPKAEHIDHVTTTTVAGVTTYAFEATDQAGVHDKITLTYQAANGGELRLAHPSSVVWQRAEPTQ
jgi:hypothetical protein